MSEFHAESRGWIAVAWAVAATVVLMGKLATGYHGGETPPDARSEERPTASVHTKTLYVPAAPAGSCCSP